MSKCGLWENQPCHVTNPFMVIFLKRYLNVIAIWVTFLSGMGMLVMISRYDSFETCTSLTNFVRTVTNISYWFVSQISRFPAGLGYNLQICVQEERQECGSFPYQSYPVEVISPPAPTPPHPQLCLKTSQCWIKFFLFFLWKITLSKKRGVTFPSLGTFWYDKPHSWGKEKNILRILFQ